MLYIGRKEGQKIYIEHGGDRLEITVAGIDMYGNIVLWFEGDKEKKFSIWREEIYEYKKAQS